MKNRFILDLNDEEMEVVRHAVLDGPDLSECPICHRRGVRISKYGISHGKQRYICSACEHSFTEAFGTLWDYRSIPRDVVERFVDMEREGYSVKQEAAKLGISASTGSSLRRELNDKGWAALDERGYFV